MCHHPYFNSQVAHYVPRSVIYVPGSTIYVPRSSRRGFVKAMCNIEEKLHWATFFKLVLCKKVKLARTPIDQGNLTPFLVATEFQSCCSPFRVVAALSGLSQPFAGCHSPLGVVAALSGLLQPSLGCYSPLWVVTALSRLLQPSPGCYSPLRVVTVLSG